MTAPREAEYRRLSSSSVITEAWSPTTWTRSNGEIHDDSMALAVPADAAPGEYVLLLGLYDPVTGVRRTVRSFVEDPRDPPLTRTDALEVGRVRVRNR